MTFASLDFTSSTSTLPSPPTVSPTPSFGPSPPPPPPSSFSPSDREWVLSPPPPPPPPPQPSPASSFREVNKHCQHHQRSHDFVIKEAFAPPSLSPSSPNQPKEQKNKGQRVSLHPTVTVHRVIHYKDYSPKEIQDTWYRRNELKAMRSIYRDLLCNLCGYNTNNHSNIKTSKGVVSTIMSCHQNHNHRRCRQQNSDGSWTLDIVNGDCLRGLEGKTTEGQNRKSQVRRVARDAVMWEQNRQRRLGYHDDDLLADLYFECSESAQVTAYLMGLKDEKEAAMDDQSSRMKTRWNSQHDDSSRRYHYHHRYHQDQDDGMEVEILAEVDLPASKNHKVSSLSSKVPRFSFSSRSPSSNVIGNDDTTMNDENLIPTSPIQIKHLRSNVQNSRRAHAHHQNQHNNMKSLISYSVCQVMN